MCEDTLGSFCTKQKNYGLGKNVLESQYQT